MAFVNTVKIYTNEISHLDNSALLTYESIRIHCSYAVSLHFEFPYQKKINDTNNHF